MTKTKKISASQLALENIEVLKTLTASEIEKKFTSVFSNGQSRNNFIRTLRKNGIDYDHMSYIENSTDFTVIDKYSNGASYAKRIHNRMLNESDINNIFYPFCTEVHLSEKEIHVIPCVYDKFGYKKTPNVKII